MSAFHAIVRAVLGDAGEVEPQLGTITLHPHQREALRRVRAALDEFGGALLADEPGLGKTFVALALARDLGGAIVVAPAALRTMWRDAADQAGVPVMFVSLERLSRRDAGCRADFVIIDEAHHAHHPQAARFARLARLTTGARVLLLTATPVRNRPAELEAMLGLFLGRRSTALDDATLARCVVRRTASNGIVPRVVGPEWRRSPRTPDYVRAIATLPPPLPALDGSEARALLDTTLLRAWSSSLAALNTALKRRLQRGSALAAALDDGRMPSRAELRQWIVGDDAVQLAFPAFAASTQLDPRPLSSVLRTHLDAVESLRQAVAPLVTADASRRAQILLTLLVRHPRERLVAFTGWAATAEALWSALRATPGVAILTARGARTASGRRRREDILAALAGARLPERPGIDDIALVIATDVLSEGVNLQGAGVIVHLDVPWTPAALEQRVGRAARIGSPHECVHVYGIAPPAATERALALDRQLVQKDAARTAAARPASDVERLRSAVARWPHDAPDTSTPVTASVTSSRDGFLAVVRTGGLRRLVGGVTMRRRLVVTDRPSTLADLAESVIPHQCAIDLPIERRARAALGRWLSRQRTQRACGGSTVAAGAHRAMLARADAALARTPIHRRPEFAARIAALRSLVSRVAGTGGEALLGELVRDERSDDSLWLDRCARALAHAARPSTPGAVLSPDPVVEALLLLTLRHPRQ